MGRLLRPRGNPGARLRELLQGPDPVLAPGAYDALSARLVEEAGFPCVYMTGFGSSASLLWQPDVGLLGMAEMVDNAHRIAAAVEVPVIADADTGYGGPINVVRTVREYERAGVAAIHLEDQVMPKRCGHLEGKQVVPYQEMVARLRAAVDARGSSDLVLIARTDARATEGLESALDRARRYHEAGADVLFIEAPQDEGEVEAVAAAFPDVPLLFNWAEGGRTPPIEYERLRQLGFKLVIFPISALLAATEAIRQVLATIRADGTPRAALTDLPSFKQFTELVGLSEVQELEARYAAEDG